jgi:hypothetical protein
VRYPGSGSLLGSGSGSCGPARRRGGKGGGGWGGAVTHGLQGHGEQRWQLFCRVRRCLHAAMAIKDHSHRPVEPALAGLPPGQGGDGECDVFLVRTQTFDRLGANVGCWPRHDGRGSRRWRRDRLCARRRRRSPPISSCRVATPCITQVLRLRTTDIGWRLEPREVAPRPPPRLAPVLDLSPIGRRVWRDIRGIFLLRFEASPRVTDAPCRPARALAFVALRRVVSGDHALALRAESRARGPRP